MEPAALDGSTVPSVGRNGSDLLLFTLSALLAADATVAAALTTRAEAEIETEADADADTEVATEAWRDSILLALEGPAVGTETEGAFDPALDPAATDPPPPPRELMALLPLRILPILPILPRLPTLPPSSLRNCP